MPTLYDASQGTFENALLDWCDEIDARGFDADDAYVMLVTVLAEIMFQAALILQVDAAPEFCGYAVRDIMRAEIEDERRVLVH